jgi:adenylosuccinate synthase
MSRGKVLALVGAQFGSEGKGAIAHHVANQFNVHVRTGGPNAGHTFYHDGEKYVMQMLPCGWVNSNATLIIGAGAVVDARILSHELNLVEKVDPAIRHRTIVDFRAGYLTPEHHAEEGGTKGEIHQRIGSTGEGVGVCRRGRLNREEGKGYKPMGEYTDWDDWDLIGDATLHLNEMYEQGATVLLEGTQGSGLSLIHGTWPYVTSHDTNAATLAADAGLAPQTVTNVMVVARTHPIRVAGNSGPLHEEVSWEVMSEKLGRHVQEITTVTRKIRRIGLWDDALFARTCRLNRPTSVALTFIDYLSTDEEGKAFEQLSNETMSFIRYVERMAGCPVSYVCTGGMPPRVTKTGASL